MMERGGMGEGGALEVLGMSGELIVLKTSRPCCMSYLGFVKKLNKVQEMIHGLPMARWRPSNFYSSSV